VNETAGGGIPGGVGDGLASPFVAVVPVRRWLFNLLLIPLVLGRRFPSYVLDRAALIHFGQWGVLARSRRERGRPGRLRSTLVFVSVFDGEVDQYIVTFASLLPLRFAQVFGFCVGFPGPVPSGPLLAFIDRHKHGSPFFYAAYGRLTMCDIRAALWISRRLAPLIDRPRPLGAAALRARLSELAAQRDRDARVVYRTPRRTLTRLAALGRPGSASFTTLAPIIPGREGQVAERLAELQADPRTHAAFAAIGSTHYARFAIIDPVRDAHDEPMLYAPARLLFSAQFDRAGAPEGESAHYAGELFDQIKHFATDPWRDCEGYPEEPSRRLFIDYLRLGRVPTGIFLPGLTATAAEIGNAAEIQRRFERLRADHLDQPSSDEALLADFAEAFGDGRVQGRARLVDLRRGPSRPGDDGERTAEPHGVTT
jgi:hypothetical protein